MKTTEETMDKRYHFVPMPADLRDELKREALEKKQPLCDVASDFIRGIINERWMPVGKDHGTVYTATKIEADELTRLKFLAAKANMSLSTYVREYQKQLQHEEVE
jgi:hypothetical protein